MKEFEKLFNQLSKNWKAPLQLTGYMSSNGYSETIDPDQCIDENGNAVYESYGIYVEKEDKEYFCTAQQMEAFAAKW